MGWNKERDAETREVVWVRTRVHFPFLSNTPVTTREIRDKFGNYLATEKQYGNERTTHRESADGSTSKRRS